MKKIIFSLICFRINFCWQIKISTEFVIIKALTSIEKK